MTDRRTQSAPGKARSVRGWVLGAVLLACSAKGPVGAQTDPAPADIAVEGAVLVGGDLPASGLSGPALPQARLQPLWELGIGAATSYSPDYPASDQSRRNFLPFPYTIYRGKYLRLDDESARIVPVETPDYSFGISVGGAFPARSEDNTARQDMPDLGYLVEIGPELVLTGPNYLDGRGTTSLALQGRGVFSMGAGNPAFRGIVLNPKLRTTITDAMGPATQLRGSVGPVFASEGVQDYFYQVKPAFAQPDRPAFNARAGYLGTDLALGLTHKLNPRTRIFASARMSFHYGAANSASPLFRDQSTGAIGIGFIYTFARSKSMVPLNRE